MVESVDTRDLKSLAFRGVPVQVWLRAPFQNDTSGSLAQSVEQRTFNPLVEGSNPSRPTIYFTDHYLTGWVVSSVGRAADS